jgi:hypothetical protein
LQVEGDGVSPVQVMISDAAGRQLLQTVVNGTSGQVDLSGLGSGVYLVKMSSGLQTLLQKLVVK